MVKSTPSPIIISKVIPISLRILPSVRRMESGTKEHTPDFGIL
jgi:hypothetical protein